MQVKFLGWSYADGGKTDKVWGIVESQGVDVVFWGRRGGKLSFKRDKEPWKLADKKKKTYREMTEEQMELESTGFIHELHKSLTFAQLGGYFHNEEHFRKI